MLKRYISLLRSEFNQYNPKRFVNDLLAGLTVAAVALPLALAFGVSSGTDAAAGLITAIVAGIVISILSGASFQISGPTGAMAAILISIIGRYTLQGVFVVSVMAGILLLLAGLFRIGKLVSVIPRPVITGFTSGIALIIALGQLDHFFGVKSKGESAIQKLLSYQELGFNVQWQQVVIGLVVVATMIFWPKKLNSIVPSSLVGLVLATIINAAFGFSSPTLGQIPQTLLPETRLMLDMDILAKWPSLISPAFSIAALSMVESLLCGTSALRMKKGSSFDADQELVAQGIGNILIPFFGGIPATAAIARTSVAIKSGSQTRLTGILHALMLLASMFLLGNVISQIPYAALAGVLMVTAWRMNEWPAIRSMFAKRHASALLKYLITLSATVVFDLTIAIIIGFAFSALVFIIKASRLEVSSSQVKNELLHTSDVDVEKSHGNTTVIYINGPVFFGNAEKLMDQAVLELMDSELAIFSMRGVSVMDTTGGEVILELVRDCRAKGISVLFCGVCGSVREQLDLAGLTELIQESEFFSSVDRALLHLSDNSSCCEIVSNPTKTINTIALENETVLE